jgi:hypothetical protein
MTQWRALISITDNGKPVLSKVEVKRMLVGLGSRKSKIQIDIINLDEKEKSA